MQETWVRFLGEGDPLEEGMATGSSILAWKIPWVEEPGKLQSLGSQRVRHDFESERESCSVVSDSLWPHGLYNPWNSPVQNTGVGSLSLLQGSSQPRDRTQVSCIAGRFFTSWATREAQHNWVTDSSTVTYTDGIHGNHVCVCIYICIHIVVCLNFFSFICMLGSVRSTLDELFFETSKQKRFFPPTVTVLILASWNCSVSTLVNRKYL